ncbi:MAG: dihydroorotate dehydrogenase [Gemmobacter sp.]|uniref:dihydroorotate dehydrogenase n=1 Tax=Gemmobacter sp. TaxID=1898957 RepID=UPI00391D12D5
MTTEPKRDPAPDVLLDDLFAAARAAPPQPVPDALLARVLADADAAMPRRPRASAPAAASARPAPPGWLAVLVAALGGRGAVAGLAAAGLAGVWIGFAQPAALPFGALAADTPLELYPGDPDLLDRILAADPASEG